MSKQKYPKIIFKLGPLAIITNYDCNIRVIRLNYETGSNKNTCFKTTIIATKLLGFVYRVHEFHFEVLK